MPPRKPKGPAPGEWKYQVGEPPLVLTAFERADKGFAIYTRVWDGRRYRSKKALCGPIRDKNGRVVPEREIVAQEKAVKRYDEEKRGAPEREAGGALTLKGGFARFLELERGKYPAVTAHYKEVTRSAQFIQDVLGPARRLDGVRHRDYRAVWRAAIQQHVRSEGKDLGLRSAEIICGVLQNAARWLQREGLLEPGDAMPAPSWKLDLKADWEAITGTPAPEPEKPRYTDAESRKLWVALESADPRLRLAVELGAELRLGQVSRVRRSDILPSAQWRIGRLRVSGRGKKKGETITLTGEQRRVLTRALLTGYLAEAEAAYRAREIEDYFLIAGGRLRKVVDHRGRPVRHVRVTGAARSLTRRALARWWEKLEEAADVPHIKGRLWYGMRRHQADRANKADVPDAVKNRMGGWTKTSTREGYLEAGKQEDADAAAVLRAQIRPKRAQRKARWTDTPRADAKGRRGKLPPKVTPDSPEGESRGRDDDATSSSE